MPSAVVPFLKLARVDRPVGTQLVYLPALAGLSMCAPSGSLPDLTLSAIFLGGAFLMRGAGCTVNDMWDRRFDAAVSRTRDRPLASGRLSMGTATIFLGAQLGAGLWCLLQLNFATGVLGVACLPLVALYPSLKRFTYFPQVALGLAMNWGILMGATAVRGGAGGSLVEGLRVREILSEPVLNILEVFSPSGVATIEAPSILTPLPQLFFDVFFAHPQAAAVIPLYLGAAAWTVVYDTIYAHQDREEDASLGLRSTALLMGRDHSRVALSLLSLGMGGSWMMAGQWADMSWPYYGGITAATALCTWQVATAEWDNRGNLAERFVGSKYVGGLLLVSCILGNVFK